MVSGWMFCVGAVAAVACGMRTAARLLPDGTTLERAAAAALLALGLVSLGTRGLLAVGVFGRWALLGVVLTACAGTFVRARPAAVRAAAPLPWRAYRPALPLLLAAGAAVLLAVAAAALLPVWQWDALGYHLPWVNHAVKHGAIPAQVRDIPYLGTYPHGVDALFAAARAWLGGEALVDAMQVPGGLLGALATAALAERWGASGVTASAAGAAWLVLPAVLLQLPTNYVDVTTAGFFVAAVLFLLIPPGGRAGPRLALFGVALGLYLGSKPSAPLPTALVALVAVAQHRKRGRALVLALGLAFATGAGSYLRNLWRFGNPLYPVRLSLGSWHLPGPKTLADLVSAGALAPRPHGSWLGRLLVSWFTWPGHMAFDTRLGGLGPVFWMGLVGAAFWLVRRGRAALAVAVLLAAALAQTEPSTARFVLAFPALVLALAGAALATAPARVRTASLAVAGVAALWSVAVAVPGLAGGVPLGDVWAAAPADRILLLDPDGAAARWRTLRAQMRPGATVAFDYAFSLSAYLWRDDLANDVLPLPWSATADDIRAQLAAHRVELLVAGDDLPAGFVARSSPERFTPLFRCGAEPCTVYRIAVP